MHIRKRRAVEHPEIVYSKAADKLCELGRFGQKTGAGWYDYKPGDRKPYPSQLVNDMIVKMVHLIMQIAPYGVFALIAAVVAAVLVVAVMAAGCAATRGRRIGDAIRRGSVP